MFKNNKKKNNDKKDENLPDEFISEKDKLIENKMEEIETSLKKYEEKSELDLSSIPDDLSELELEIHSEQSQNIAPKNKTQISGKDSPATARFKPDLKNILPTWIEKPYYYITPSEKLLERRKLWQKEWADFLLQWANAKDKYLIEIITLQQEYPFKNPVISKQLTLEQLRIIGDFLEESKTALWKNKNKTHIRIYWETLESTADEIFSWAFERGQKYIGVFDILDAKQPFSDLPSEEIYECLVLLVKEKKGEWADKKKEIVYLLFPS
jgi:hypothetical protein